MGSAQLDRAACRCCGSGLRRSTRSAATRTAGHSADGSGLAGAEWSGAAAVRAILGAAGAGGAQSIDRSGGSARISFACSNGVFGPDPAAAALVLPAVPLDELYAEPARAGSRREAARCASMRPRRVIDRERPGDGVRVREEVIARRSSSPPVPWHAFDALFDAPPPELQETIANATALASLPIVTVNLWFDRAVMEESLVGFRAAISNGCSIAARIVGGEAVALVADVKRRGGRSSSMSNEQLAAMALSEVREALPAARGRRCERASRCGRSDRHFRSHRTHRRGRARDTAIEDCCWPATGSKRAFRPRLNPR